MPFVRERSPQEFHPVNRKGGVRLRSESRCTSLRGTAWQKHVDSEDVRWVGFCLYSSSADLFSQAIMRVFEFIGAGFRDSLQFGFVTLDLFQCALQSLLFF